MKGRGDIQQEKTGLSVATEKKENKRRKVGKAKYGKREIKNEFAQKRMKNIHRNNKQPRTTVGKEGKAEEKRGKAECGR